MLTKKKCDVVCCLLNTFQFSRVEHDTFFVLQERRLFFSRSLSHEWSSSKESLGEFTAALSTASDTERKFFSTACLLAFFPLFFSLFPPSEKIRGHPNRIQMT